MFGKDKDLEGLKDYKPGKASKGNAEELKAQAGPAARRAAEDARNWAVPQLQKAKYTAVGAAAPAVGRAAEALAPAVDAARDALIEDILPRLQELADEALYNAEEAADQAGTAAKMGLGAVAAGAPVAAKASKKRGKKAEKQSRKARKNAKKNAAKFAKQAQKEYKAAQKAEKKAIAKHTSGGGKGKAFVTVTVLAAGAGGAYYFYKKSQPKTDPWVAATNANAGSAGPTTTSGPTATMNVGGDDAATPEPSTLGAYDSTKGAPPVDTVVPERAVDMTDDIDHTVGGMSEDNEHRDH